MRPCPQCKLAGVVETKTGHWETCPFCGGDKYVSHFKLVDWELHKGTAPPDSERDFSQLADSSKPPPPPEKA